MFSVSSERSLRVLSQGLIKTPLVMQETKSVIKMEISVMVLWKQMKQTD